MELTKPIKLRSGEIIKNRLLKSAMSEVMGDDEGLPTRGLYHLYKVWAEGGTGLLISGNVMIDGNHLGEFKNVILQKDTSLSTFQNWASAGRQNGASFWMQLNHPGKQSPKFLNKDPVAPSAVAPKKVLKGFLPIPRALTEVEIENIIDQFAKSALQAKQAGFSGVQIHGAHGYLVSQFLSPKMNVRTDKWGGSLENRARFALSVYKAIRKQVGVGFSVGIKLNSSDFQTDGFSFEDSIQVCKWLDEAGIDLIEISGGNYESAAMVGDHADERAQRSAYFVDFAKQLKPQLSCPLAVTGGFRHAKVMNECLSDGVLDMVGIARPLCVDASASNKLLEDLDYQIKLDRPSTGFKQLDMLSMMDITWFENQIHRMAKGKRINPNMSAFKSMLLTMASLGVNGFKQRRG